MRGGYVEVGCLQNFVGRAMFEVSVDEGLHSGKSVLIGMRGRKILEVG